MGARIDARRALRSALALALLLWLGVETTVGAVRIGAQVERNAGQWHSAFTAPLEERRRRTLDARDQEAGRPPGYLNGIVDAVLAHVPEAETLHATGFRTIKEAEALVPVPYLCFPRRLARAPADLGPDWEPLEQSYLLVLGERANDWLGERKRVLASGPGWTLWR
jgi:hypothetical protein